MFAKLFRLSLLPFPAIAVFAADAALANPVVVGHRGACAYLPEHTLEGKAMAHAMGVDFVEQDVVMTRDNELVVIHDHLLETVTDVARKFPDRARKDGHYYAIDFTLAEIKSLLVHERTDPKTGKAVFPDRFPLETAIDFRVPTLREELEMVAGLNKSRKRDVGVYVEVKYPAFHLKEGKDATRATIDMLTEFGYNKPDGKAILQIFDFDAVKNAREKYGWRGSLCMLVDTKEAQSPLGVYGAETYKDDRKEHEWLMTEEGIREVSKYANIYAPWFGNICIADDKGGYNLTNHADLARKYGMKVHSWTHRADSLWKPFKSSDEELDVAFKELKLDGLFSDCPDVVIDYLKRNGMR